MTGQELLAAGLDPATDPRLLQLFAEGQEQAFAVRGEDDGRFDSSDSIEFYGLGLDTPSTNTRTYWLVAGSQPGQRIKAAKKKGSRAASPASLILLNEKIALFTFHLSRTERQRISSAQSWRATLLISRSCYGTLIARQTKTLRSK